LKAADLGLLAGAYFLGFSALQLPLGHGLDRFGPKRVLLFLMTLAVLGCGAFALAQSLPGLILARVLIGMGLAACLMAPLTCFRLRYSQAAQFRSNSWMLMTGSLGMVASTLPVQWLLPVWGWRGLFWVLAGCLLVLGWTYVGYPLWLLAMARLRPRPVVPRHWQPHVTVCMAVHNGMAHLDAKIDGLLAHDYPADRLDLVVVSDGSTDGTVAASAEGWNGTEWRAVADAIAKSCAWSRPNMPVASDPGPFHGTPALAPS
jgi:MFS family permease